MWVRSLDQEDSPEAGHGNPLQYSSRKFHSQRSLAGYSPWGHKESGTTEPLSTSWKRYPHSKPQGATQGGPGRMQTDCRDVGHLPLLGSMGGVIWDSQARAMLMISNQKSGVWHGDLLQGVHQPYRYWQSEKTVDHKGCWGSHIRNLYLLLPLADTQGT